jgi:hypothetical protein
MCRAIRIPNGIICLVDTSDVECPKCGRQIPWEEIEEKWVKAKNNNGFIRIKDKCQRFIGIAMSMTGKFHAYDLEDDQKLL